MTERISIGTFTPTDAREIKRRVLGDKSKVSPAPLSYPQKDQQGWHYGILKEDLPAASNPLTGYTQADCAVLVYEEGKDTLDMEEVVGESNYYRITNRSLTFSAGVGDMILFRWVDKEWAPVVGSGGIQLFHGIIVAECDPVCNVYEVQRVHRYLLADCEECGSSSSGSA
jgi:hypothetical protein